jgi:hypothetical protein
MCKAISVATFGRRFIRKCVASKRILSVSVCAWYCSRSIQSLARLPLCRRSRPSSATTAGASSSKTAPTSAGSRSRTSPVRRLCRPYPKGREAGRSAGHAVHQGRANHQPQDRQGAQSHCSYCAACARRRGDRVSPACARTPCCICSQPVMATLGLYLA